MLVGRLTARRTAHRSMLHTIATAGVVACLMLGGCAAMTTNHVVVDPPVLPVPLIDRMPVRIGVHFPEALRNARVDTSYVLFSDRYIWWHEIGNASVAGLRQALKAAFADVVELERWPSQDAADLGLAAVIVPGRPSMHAIMSMNAVVLVYQQGIEFPFELFSPAGERLTGWTAQGIAGVGAHGPMFTRQKLLDQWTLRSAMAAFIASLHREPSLAALRGATGMPAAVPDTAAPRDTGVLVLRLDAGLAHDDGIERRIAACLAEATPPPRPLDGKQPAGALRDALFPWLDPGVAPGRKEEIETLLGLPRVRDRLASLGASHLVLFTVRDAARSKKDNMGCFGGLGAAACFGIYEEKNSYVTEMAVWDTFARRPVGEGQSEVTRAVGFIGALLPIPYFSSNEEQACTQMRNLVRGAVGSQR